MRQLHPGSKYPEIQIWSETTQTGLRGLEAANERNHAGSPFEPMEFTLASGSLADVSGWC